MRPSILTRLEKLEAARHPLVEFVVVVVDKGQSGETSIIRSTQDREITDRTLVFLIDLS